MVLRIYSNGLEGHRWWEEGKEEKEEEEEEPVSKE